MAMLPPGGMNSGDDMRARHRDLLRDTHHLHEARRLGFKTHFWTTPFIVLGVVIGAILLVSFVVSLVTG